MDVATRRTKTDVGAAIARMPRRQGRPLPVLARRGPLFGIARDDILPGSSSTPAYRGDVVVPFRTVAGKRPLRKTA